SNNETFVKLELQHTTRPNLSYISHEGKIHLYDQQLDEIESWISSYLHLGEGKHDVTIYGLELTYHLVELLKLNHQNQFYILEPEIEILIESLKVVDFSKLLEHPQIK